MFYSVHHIKKKMMLICSITGNVDTEFMLKVATARSWHCKGYFGDLNILFLIKLSPASYFRMHWGLLLESTTTTICVYIYIQWFTTHFSDHFFKFSYYLKVSQWKPLQSMLLLAKCHHFLSTAFLLLPGIRCSCSSCTFPWPSLGISHFSKESWFLLVGNNI